MVSMSLMSVATGFLAGFILGETPNEGKVGKRAKRRGSWRKLLDFGKKYEEDSSEIGEKDTKTY